MHGSKASVAGRGFEGFEYINCRRRKVQWVGKAVRYKREAGRSTRGRHERVPKVKPRHEGDGKSQVLDYTESAFEGTAFLCPCCAYLGMNLDQDDHSGTCFSVEVNLNDQLLPLTFPAVSQGRWPPERTLLVSQCELFRWKRSALSRLWWRAVKGSHDCGTSPCYALGEAAYLAIAQMVEPKW